MEYWKNVENVDWIKNDEIDTETIRETEKEVDNTEIVDDSVEQNNWNYDVQENNFNWWNNIQNWYQQNNTWKEAWMMRLEKLKQKWGILNNILYWLYLEKYNIKKIKFNDAMEKVRLKQQMWLK